MFYYQSRPDIIFFYGIGDVNHHLGIGFSLDQGFISAVKRIEFISDRLLV
jgi:hypothetical protein